ncbi:MAG: Crp/Fnr family transcriptional regulator [Minwuia sp.]|uniref:Crp/Fnr family transcriptional regulator n=1 Tax=Minwuia sp. TaxID=2493630 RepID=UPI003A8630B4
MTQQQALGTLNGCELLGGLAPEQIEALERRCTWRRFKNGEQVLDRNSDSRDVFFVVEGEVQIVNYSASGREIAYATVKTGGYFGELAAIDGEPRSASAVAQGACVLAQVSPSVFMDFVGESPSVGQRVMKRLARIIRTCDERIMDLSTLGAVQRVYLELLRLAEEDPVTQGAWVIYPMPTQSNIAARASTTRETVARVISQLAQEELVKKKGKSLYLWDRDALAIRAEKMSPNEPQAR